MKMKTKLMCLVRILLVVFACVGFSACSSKDDDDMGTTSTGVGNYYFQLYTVETNLIDANSGISLKTSLMEEWKNANNADSQYRISLGKMDKEKARTTFSTLVNSLLQQYNNAYAGKNLLPESGYILYSFVVCSDDAYAGANENKIIQITNSGAEFVSK
jgi:hypothetical protein